MRRVRRKRQNKKHLLVICFIFVTAITVMSVGYSIIVEKLSVTGTATILPKTNESTAFDYILGKMGSTTADQNTKGLYKDNDEYYYKGVSCDNYIKFNGSSDTWLILSFTKDSIKILRSFDNILTSPWNETATAVTWKESTILANLKTWYQSNMTIYSDKIISNPLWNINAAQKSTPSVLETTEAAFTDSQIGLITTYEYSRSNSTSGTFDTTWMYDGQYVWTMTRNASSTTQAWRVNTKFNNSTMTNTNTFYRPVIYIKVTNTLTGSGTSTDPFIIE